MRDLEWGLSLERPRMEKSRAKIPPHQEGGGDRAAAIPVHRCEGEQAWLPREAGPSRPEDSSSASHCHKAKEVLRFFCYCCCFVLFFISTCLFLTHEGYSLLRKGPHIRILTSFLFLIPFPFPPSSSRDSPDSPVTFFVLDDIVLARVVAYNVYFF